MANLNKVMLIGRLTRDPEVRVFSNGGKVAKFGFAGNNRKYNQPTGQWEDEPCFLDVEVVNRGDTGKKADVAEQYLSKGKQVFLEGKLRMDSWTTPDGQKRNKLLIVVDDFQFLEPKDGGQGGGEGGGGGGGGYRKSAPANKAPAPDYDQHGGDEMPEFGSSQNDGDIPF